MGSDTAGHLMWNRLGTTSVFLIRSIITGRSCCAVKGVRSLSH